MIYGSSSVPEPRAKSLLNGAIELAAAPMDNNTRALKNNVAVVAIFKSPMSAADRCRSRLARVRRLLVK